MSTIFLAMFDLQGCVKVAQNVRFSGRHLYRIRSWMELTWQKSIIFGYSIEKIDKELNGVAHFRVLAFHDCRVAF